MSRSLPTPDLDVATFDRLFTANVRAPYFLVAALAPKMAARGSGSIVNIGSMAGPRRHAWRRRQGRAGGDDPVVGGRVQPRWRPGQRCRRRARLHPLQSPEQAEAVGATTIMARVAQPHEMANVIVFLASPDASYIAGAVVAADGGRTAI